MKSRVDYKNKLHMCLFGKNPVDVMHLRISFPEMIQKRVRQLRRGAINSFTLVCPCYFGEDRNYRKQEK